ncbi:MAG: PilZ domain-containing protein [Candidatus Sumerlaeia bacterium]
MNDDTAIRVASESVRRVSRRFQAAIKARLRILFPEETFTPIEYECVTQDVSESGMRIVVDRLPTALYFKLMASIRYARISLLDPCGGGDVKLTGKIVWIDYRSGLADQPDGSCQMGISFEGRDAHELAEMVRLLGNDDLRGLAKEAILGT